MTDKGRAWFPCLPSYPKDQKVNLSLKSKTFNYEVFHLEMTFNQSPSTWKHRISKFVRYMSLTCSQIYRVDLYVHLYMNGYLIAIANTISQCFVEQKQAIICIHKGPLLSFSQKNKKFYLFLINTLFFNWRKIIALQHCDGFCYTTQIKTKQKRCKILWGRPLLISYYTGYIKYTFSKGNSIGFIIYLPKSKGL